MKKNLFGVSLVALLSLYVSIFIIVSFLFLLFGISVVYSLILSFIILAVYILFSTFLIDFSIKLYSSKVNFDYELPDYLNSFISQICAKYNIKVPKIGIINSKVPNSFSYGISKNKSRLILTSGIFDLLSEEEVIAVVAHEFGHITHYDRFFMTVVQSVPLFLYVIFSFFFLTQFDENSTAPSDISTFEVIIGSIGLLAYGLYFIVQFLIFPLSRKREYYADDFSIEITKNPNSLASALVKIGYGLSSTNSLFDREPFYNSLISSSALCISDVKTSRSLFVGCYGDGNIFRKSIKNIIKWEQCSIWAKKFQRKALHPLLSKRLFCILNRCYDYNQKPYIELNLQKDKSHIGCFLIDYFVKYLPLFTIIITLILMLRYKTYLMFILGIGGILTFVFSFLIFFRKYNKNFVETNILNLLGEVKVSDVNGIPCIINGEVTSRDNGGCSFCGDFIIKDDTGVILLNYKNSVKDINELFNIFEKEGFFGKKVKLKGWYRRNPVPYVEIFEIDASSNIKKFNSYFSSVVIRIVVFVIFVLIFIFSLCYFI